MASLVTKQNDFSAGELDVSTKRDDSPITKAGLRQARNYRILNSKSVTNRPGRRALFKESDRVEEILMAPGVTYYIAFPSGFVKIYDATGTSVASVARPWNAATAKDVVYAIIGKSIYITFAGMVPFILSWDGVVTWTGGDFAFQETSGGQKRTPFYRISPKGITLLPSVRTGTVNLTFSAGMNLVSGMIGTRIRYLGRQIEIATVTSPTTGTGTVKQPLPASQVLTFGSDPRDVFALGEVVENAAGQQGYITALSATQMTVQLLTASASDAAAGK